MFIKKRPAVDRLSEEKRLNDRKRGGEDVVKTAKLIDARRVSRRSFAGWLSAWSAGIERPAFARASSIKVGLSAGLTGPIAETVKAYVAGLQLPLDKTNDEKGIAGKRVELVVLDDQYQGQLAVANTQIFLDKGVDVLAGYVGTGTVEKTLSFLNQRDLLLFGPFTGAVQLRNLKSPNAIFITGDYRSEIDRLVNHFSAVGSTRFAIIFQNDSFGKPLAEYAQKALAAKGRTASHSVSLESGAVATQEQIEKIVSLSPHAVFMFTVAGPTISMLKVLRKTYAGSVGLLSFLSNRAFISALGKDAAGVVISQVVPGPYDSTHPLVREIFDNHPNVDRAEVTQAFITGYLTGKLLVETLKASNGKTGARQLRVAWNSIKAKNPFGFTFSESGAQFTDIAMLRSDGRFIH